jgi:TetR/AcrR family transcriptional repressor of nem operon
MARPREFETDEVLDAAMRVFSTYGFAGASVSLLQEATGLSRASLYGAFGDKEGLYRAALGLYTARMRAAITKRHPDYPPLRAYLLASLDVACDGTGCLVAQSNDEIENLPAQARADICSAISSTRAFVRETVAEAQQKGEIAAHHDPDLITGMILVFQRGLSSLSRQISDREELDRQVEGFLQLLR